MDLRFVVSRLGKSICVFAKPFSKCSQHFNLSWVVFNKACTSTATPTRLIGACHLLGGCHRSFPMREKCVHNDQRDREALYRQQVPAPFGTLQHASLRSWPTGEGQLKYLLKCSRKMDHTPNVMRALFLFSRPVKRKQPRAQRCSRDHLAQPKASRQIKLYFNFINTVQVRRGQVCCSGPDSKSTKCLSLEIISLTWRWSLSELSHFPTKSFNYRRWYTHTPREGLITHRGWLWARNFFDLTRCNFLSVCKFCIQLTKASVGINTKSFSPKLLDRIDASGRCHICSVFLPTPGLFAPKFNKHTLLHESTIAGFLASFTLS